ATRSAAERAAAAKAEARQRCLENRSRWQKLRGKDEGCGS
ncbi:patatin-like phospholipase family protein, partial [Xanthomonas sp. Kuri4-1]